MNKPRTWIDAMSEPMPIRSISPADYLDWQKTRVFDCCRGLTQGQSFCEYFGLEDNLLLYNVIHDTAIDSYIRDTYLETKFLAH